MEADRMVGVLAIRDVMARLDRHGAAAIEESIASAMTREVVTVDPGTTLEEAHGLFVSEGINHLPVVEDGRLVGLVTPFDVLGSHVEDIGRQREMLQAYITNAIL
jgi:predicted transcriptional regulator